MENINNLKNLTKLGTLQNYFRNDPEIEYLLLVDKKLSLTEVAGYFQDEDEMQVTKLMQDRLLTYQPLDNPRATVYSIRLNPVYLYQHTGHMH